MLTYTASMPTPGSRTDNGAPDFQYVRRGRIDRARIVPPTRGTNCGWRLYHPRPSKWSWWTGVVFTRPGEGVAMYKGEMRIVPL